MALEVTIPSIEPSGFFETITTSDTTEYTGITALYIGSVAGGSDLVLTDQAGNDVTFTVVAGGVVPVSPLKIKATGTTASAIVALK